MIGVITHPVFLWTLLGVVLSGVAFWIVSCVVASYLVYVKTLKRESRDKWSRDIPSDLGEQSVAMYEIGCAWGRENERHKTDVHIVRDGLNLYGEYYDLGYDKCVMILSGRTECLKYGYYFAIPYANNGYNVLVVDPRGHGLSDGEYNTVGFEESRDAIAWIEHIRDTFGIRFFVFHGICIGAAGGMLALASGKCPLEVKAIVTEGMFPNFKQSVKNHMIEQKRPRFLTLDLVDAWMKHFTGHSMKYGPLDVIDNVSVPLLMLHSKEDLYSTPEYARRLYYKSGSQHKRLVWFEHGKHSMLRITDTELYDNSISEFLADISAIENNINTEKEKENVL